MDGLIGQTIGPYKITAKIGEGGMAVVYKGYQQSLNRYVAIKVLRSELAQDEQFVTRFRREALAVAELSHPNILHVYDAGVAHGMYYIVMAYVDGGSLRDLIAQGPMEMDYAVSMAAQLADALDHAHRQGIVHRDVKPNNVLITRDGRPLLTDFGIAKALNETQALTRTGTSIGTPEYMAPEQIQGQKVDGRTDIYALGIVLYEMLVGWAPFSATTPVAALYKQVNEPPPPLRQANISVPDWLDAVVIKALAKRPQDRYQHSGEFAEALRQRRAPTRVPPPVPAGTPVPVTKKTGEQKRRKSIVPLLIGAIVLLLVAVAVAAVVLFGDGSGGTPEGTPRVVTITRVITPTAAEANPSAPALLSPAAGEQLSGRIRFGWRWDGAPLAADQAFQLRIWSQAQEDSGAEPPVAAEPSQQTFVEVELGNVPAVREHGPGVYYWTVVVVDAANQRVVGDWGEKRLFNYVNQ
jgi:tRNA A-37 threonylcarbamoyl transferase component Bud32